MTPEQRWHHSWIREKNDDRWSRRERFQLSGLEALVLIGVVLGLALIAERAINSDAGEIVLYGGLVAAFVWIFYDSFREWRRDV